MCMYGGDHSPLDDRFAVVSPFIVNAVLRQKKVQFCLSSNTLYFYDNKMKRFFYEKAFYDNDA